jgi:very-short-patch-repair endonuclease
LIRHSIWKIDSPIQGRLAEALVVGGAYYTQRAETLEIRTEETIVIPHDRFYRADFTLRLTLGDELLARLVVEADGKAYHNAEADRHRDEQMLELGWNTRRYTGAAINSNAHACASDALAWLETLREQRFETKYQAAERAAASRREAERPAVMAEVGAFLARLKAVPS